MANISCKGSLTWIKQIRTPAMAVRHANPQRPNQSKPRTNIRPFMFLKLSWCVCSPHSSQSAAFNSTNHQTPVEICAEHQVGMISLNHPNWRVFFWTVRGTTLQLRHRSWCSIHFVASDLLIGSLYLFSFQNGGKQNTARDWNKHTSFCFFEAFCKLNVCSVSIILSLKVERKDWTLFAAWPCAAMFALTSFICGWSVTFPDLWFVMSNFCSFFIHIWFESNLQI